jgi:hypothetical protein
MTDHLITVHRDTIIRYRTEEQGVLNDAQKAKFDALPTDEHRYQFLIDEDVLDLTDTEARDELSEEAILIDVEAVER